MAKAPEAILPLSGVSSIGERHAATASLVRIEGPSAPDAPKQAGAVSWSSIADGLNAAAARAAGRR